MNRRATVAVGLVAWCVGWACAAQSAIGEEPLVVREIARGIYVHAGLQEEASPSNRGDIANVGFVVGATCVAVIDTGGTLAVGRALRAAVRRVSALPVCFVVNTHVHPDHVFGNAAFIDERPEFVGHARLAAAMAARGENYERALLRDLGDVASGSTMVSPTSDVEQTRTIDLGGRVLQLRAWPSAHTDDDLTVFDEATGTWWLSDLLFVERVPVVDGSVRGWLKALAELRSWPAPAHVVPGHGPVDSPWAKSLDDERRYLETVVREVRAAIKAGRSMQQTVDTAGQSEQPRWLLFDRYHRRNVTAAFAELEWED